MKGILFVVSGASGVGKGSIISLSRAQLKNVEFSVSWTTRPPRRSEVDGVDYHFKTRDEFEQELNEGGFLEHAEFVGNLYGTPHKQVNEVLMSGRDLILDIELNGALQIKEKMPNAIFILVVPPNLSILRLRLLRRGTDTIPVIKQRLIRAVGDMRKFANFDYVIVNDELHNAVDDLTAIIRAERLKTLRLDQDSFATHSRMDPNLEPELDRIEQEIKNSNPS